MPIAKSNGTVATTVGIAPAVDHTPPVAGLDTLGKQLLQTVTDHEESKGRDYKAEARGKVACAAFNAALSSPGLAGLGFTNYDEYMAFVKKAADASVAYTWAHQK